MKMKILPWIIVIIPFMGFFFTVIWERSLIKDILELMKDIYYQKYKHLTSSSFPILGGVMLVSPYRFNKFIKEGNYYDHPELLKKAAAYQKNSKVSYIFWGIFAVLLVIFGIFEGFASS